MYGGAMRTILISILASTLALTACGKKDGAGKADDKGAPKAAESSGATSADPKAIWADFHGGLKGMDLMNKYHDAVTITGTVVKNGPFTQIDVDGTNRIGLEFTDPSVGEKLAAGSTATVKCKIAGTGGDASKVLHTSDCTQ
jgi:hypothetical protein